MLGSVVRRTRLNALDSALTGCCWRRLRRLCWRLTRSNARSPQPKPELLPASPRIRRYPGPHHPTKVCESAWTFSPPDLSVPREGRTDLGFWFTHDARAPSTLSNADFFGSPSKSMLGNRTRRRDLGGIRRVRFRRTRQHLLCRLLRILQHAIWQ